MLSPFPRRRRAALVALVAVAAALVSPAAVRAQIAPPGPAAAQTYLTPQAARTEADRQITPAQLKDYLSFIASDEMEGRDTPSRGLNTVAKFLALNLSRWGFKPLGGDGTFFQKIALRRTRASTDRARMTLGGAVLRAGEDFLPAMGYSQGADAEIAAPAPLVYVSHGWQLPSRKIDAYAGVDVKGKILVVTGRGLPEGVHYHELMGPGSANWVAPLAYAQTHGAVGVVFLAESADDYDALRAQPEDVAPPTQNAGDGPKPTIPAVVVSPGVIQTLFAGEPLSAGDALKNSAKGALSPAFDFAAVKRAAFAARYATDTVYTQNVVARWEGGDPLLKSDYVALGAHYDHLGLAAKPNETGDRVYNGADDDGSGTTGLLAIAEAVSHAPVRPKRSLLFVWHCGEEKGLWGSEYFTDHPTVPLERIVTQLNIDMIGRSKPLGDDDKADAELSGPHEVYVIGSKLLSTELGQVSERANRDYKKLLFNYRYDNPQDPNRFFYRSDHFNYARKGIPIIFYFDGVHRDYHQVTDEVDKIDFGKFADIARTVLVTATELADLARAPVVDKTVPGVPKR